MITWSDLKEYTDSIGVQLDRLEDALGTGVEADSVSIAALTNLERIQDIASTGGGDDPQTAADLMQNSINHLARVSEQSNYAYEFFALEKANLENHLRNRGVSGSSQTLDEIATTAGSDERYCPSFARLYRALGGVLTASNVYSPVIVLGTESVSGAGAGTFTDGAAVDDDLYGACDIEAEATSTNTNIVITASCVDEDGDTTTATGTLNGASGTKVDLTVTSGKRIVDVTSVAFTGGQAAETFKIQTKVDRTPAE